MPEFQRTPKITYRPLGFWHHIPPYLEDVLIETYLVPMLLAEFPEPP